MRRPAVGEAQASPERLVTGLVSHLRRHLLWDSLLLSFPPLSAFFSIWALVDRSGFSGERTLIFAVAVVLASTVGIGILRLRAALPSLRTAARLVDEKVEGKERFVTLATLNRSLYPPFLVDRLRREAAALAHRLDLKRDFSYKVKSSFFQSLIVSLSVILIFLLLPQFGPILSPGARPEDKLANLAQRLSQVRRLAELGRALETLAARLRERGVTDEEKRSRIEEVLRQIESQRALEQQGAAADDLLNQAADALQGLERDLEKNQGPGGKEKSPGEEKGSGDKSSHGDKQEERGELSSAAGTERTGTEPGVGEKQKADRRGAGTGPGAGEQGGKERDKSREAKGTGKEESGGKGSKEREQEIPKEKGAERFLKPGEEGKKGIKGARFVTVELPEAESGSETGQGGPGKRGKVRPKTPVSNVPLRERDLPQATAEKQPLPLEYRGLIH